jgi:hypothetical protein
MEIREFHIRQRYSSIVQQPTSRMAEQSNWHQIIFQRHVADILNFDIDSQSSHNSLKINNCSVRCVLYYMSLIPCDMFRAISLSSDNTTYNPLGDIDTIRTTCNVIYHILVI